MQEKQFSFVARAKSFNYAWRGLLIFFKTTHNAWLHIFFGGGVIILGIILKITHIEWMVLVFAIGLVLVAEAFNSAIEIDIDLTSPDEHPYARDTKDVAAGAVLLAALTASVIGLLVFEPYILALLK